MKKIYFIQHLFKVHIKTESKVRRALFERFAFYNEILFIVGVMVYCGAAASFFPYSIYMYLFEDKRVPLLSMYIPGIDENTLVGYFTLITLQILLLILAIIGMSACDIMYAMMLANIPNFCTDN